MPTPGPLFVLNEGFRPRAVATETDHMQVSLYKPATSVIARML